jgi:phospholipid/cholesterol/gamma-HCH transport system permease protein
MAATVEGWAKLTAASTLEVGGRWQVAALGQLDAALAHIVWPRQGVLRIDLAKLDLLDTAGAWLLRRTVRRLEADGLTIELVGLREEHRRLLDIVAEREQPAMVEPKEGSPTLAAITRLGAGVVEGWRQTVGLVAFFGLVLATAARCIPDPRRWRPTALVFHMEKVGLDALPIVGLISLLIGIVMAYQGAAQLQRFGAQVFVVNLVAISVLREIGILLTAIVVAGRSGSAFTAQLGSMSVSQEVDAMRAMGLDPIEYLVLPRVLALVIALPLLAFFADMMGLLGGMLMCWGVLDISPVQYIERLRYAIGVNSFWVGLVKAPVFAAVIAMIGCYQGLRVSGGAEAVGQHTTRAVVESIFLVIVADALFSVFFAAIGV